MADWWRAWHELATDPKWAVVGKRAKAPVGNVAAIAETRAFAGFRR